MPNVPMNQMMQNQMQNQNMYANMNNSSSNMMMNNMMMNNFMNGNMGSHPGMFNSMMQGHGMYPGTGGNHANHTQPSPYMQQQPRQNLNNPHVPNNQVDINMLSNSIQQMTN